MAQGKLKVKAKVPKGVKVKKPVTKKPLAASKARANKPIQPKKKSFEEARKLKQVISKTVNKTLEEDIRQMASGESKTNLSKVQQAVAAHNSKKT